MLTLSTLLVAALVQQTVPIVPVPSRRSGTIQSSMPYTDPPPGIVPLPPLPPDRAALTFFLPAGADNKCEIRYRGRTLITIEPGSYVQWAVRPGRYAFAVQSDRLVTSAERGKTQFVRCDTVNHHGRAALKIVSEQQYEEIAGSLTRQPPIKLETDPRFMKR